MSSTAETEPTGALKHRDDHVLVISGDAGAPDIRVECPYGTDRHGKSCSYWDGCRVCTAACDQDVRTVQKVLGDESFELLIQDWIDGCFFVIGPDGLHNDDLTNAVHETTTPNRPRLTVPGHEECLDHGLPSHAWEGEIVHATGKCFVAEEVMIEPREYASLAFEDSEHEFAPGRWIISYVNNGEDGIELHIEGKAT